MNQLLDAALDLNAALAKLVEALQPSGNLRCSWLPEEPDPPSPLETA